MELINQLMSAGIVAIKYHGVVQRCYCMGRWIFVNRVAVFSKPKASSKNVNKCEGREDNSCASYMYVFEHQ